MYKEGAGMRVLQMYNKGTAYNASHMHRGNVHVVQPYKRSAGVQRHAHTQQQGVRVIRMYNKETVWRDAQT